MIVRANADARAVDTLVSWRCEITSIGRTRLATIVGAASSCRAVMDAGRNRRILRVGKRRPLGNARAMALSSVWPAALDARSGAAPRFPICASRVPFSTTACRQTMSKSKRKQRHLQCAWTGNDLCFCPWRHICRYRTSWTATTRHGPIVLCNYGRRTIVNIRPRLAMLVCPGGIKLSFRWPCTCRWRVICGRQVVCYYSLAPRMTPMGRGMPWCGLTCRDDCGRLWRLHRVPCIQPVPSGPKRSTSCIPFGSQEAHGPGWRTHGIIISCLHHCSFPVSISVHVRQTAESILLHLCVPA